MYTQYIMQELLDAECPPVHAKRGTCVAAIVDADSKGRVSLMGISRVLSSSSASNAS